MKCFSIMTKGIIYYTDNCLDEPIYSIVQEYIKKSGLPITSCSPKPIDFGANIVVLGKRSYWTMAKQITAALEKSTADNVFFCEHDVLYPLSHFDFIPPRDDIFYYNDNVWRWKYRSNVAISYDRLISLSGLCVNRQLALNHYQERLKKIEAMSQEEREKRDPHWARKWGYEPGTKKRRRGGFSNDDFETWRSEYPIVDIRHPQVFSPLKVIKKSFTHQPTGWREITIDKIPGWNLKELFNLKI